jgi:hypothetical protein
MRLKSVTLVGNWMPYVSLLSWRLGQCWLSSSRLVPIRGLKDGYIHSDTVSKADILNKQFHSVYTKADYTNMPDKGPSPYPSMMKIQVNNQCESSNMMSVWSPSSMFRVMSSMVISNWDSQDLLTLNPCCSSQRTWWRSKWSMMELWTMCCNSLQAIEVSDTDR